MDPWTRGDRVAICESMRLTDDERCTVTRIADLRVPDLVPVSTSISLGAAYGIVDNVCMHVCMIEEIVNCKV